MNEEIVTLRQELEKKYGMCFIFVVPDGILFQINDSRGQAKSSIAPFNADAKDIEKVRKEFKDKLEKKVERKRTAKKGPSRKSGGGSGTGKASKASE